MTKGIQIKLLAAILAFLVVIAGLLARGGREMEITPADRQLQRKLSQKVAPPERTYLIP